MEITHIGHSCFKLKGKGATVITDPFAASVTGLPFPKITADIVIISHEHQDHNYTSAVEGSPIIISGPGEYEMKNVKIIGIPTYHDDTNGNQRGVNVIYHLDVDSIAIVFCGDLGHVLNDKQIELLNGVDILLIPTGGNFTIDSTQASKIVSQLEPKVIIPMHYQVPGLNSKLFANLAPVSVFLKEMGKESVLPVPKYVVTKDKLPSEPTIIVIE